MNAQVTIGADIPPREGALLDMKESNIISGNNITATKGMLYPRVGLTSKNNLFPMFENDGSGGYKIGSTPHSKVTEDNNHIGLTVFNVTNAGDFVPGLHIWDGAEWRRLDDNPVIQPQISSLICGSITMIPNKYTAGTPFEGLLKVPYIGGNGGVYSGTAAVAIGNGLSISRIGGTLAIGGGEVMYRVFGTPTVTSPTITQLTVDFLGKTCTAINVGSGDVTSVYVKNLTTDAIIDAPYSSSNTATATTVPFESITIPEAGSYAFSIRLYGKINTTAVGRRPFYIYLHRNDKTNANMMDCAEIDIVTINQPVDYQDYSYSITLGGAFEAGDDIIISMHRGASDPRITLKAGGQASPVRTSLIYWKL
ncbi:MAG: hypothetical protein LBP25_05530 [Tannerellaceae bacterium]|nr:hypothetical protein [Tannerellaceae bacterium]